MRVGRTLTCSACRETAGLVALLDKLACRIACLLACLSMLLGAVLQCAARTINNLIKCDAVTARTAERAAQAC